MSSLPFCEHVLQSSTGDVEDAYEVLGRRIAVAPKSHCTKLIRDLTMSKDTFQKYMEDRFPTFFGSSQ